MAAFSWSARYYYQQSVRWQEKASEASSAVRRYEVQLKVLQRQQRRLAELDEHYTEKINEAVQENRTLRTQLARGHRRMLVSGKTPVQTGHLPQPAAWAMMAPSNSLQMLDSVFFLSGKASSGTSKK